MQNGADTRAHPSPALWEKPASSDETLIQALRLR